MKFASITDQSDFFNEYGCRGELYPENQGILGLGYPVIESQYTDSFATLFFNRFLIAPDIFAIQMCQFDGNLWLGGYDSSYLKSSISYTSITEESYYVVGMTGLSLGTSFIADGGSFGKTIVDSGTTLLILPQSVYDILTTKLNQNRIFSRQFPDFWVPKSGGLVCTQPTDGLTPDQLNELLPSLTITLDNVVLELSPVSSYLRIDVSVAGYVRYCWGVMPTTEDIVILGWSVMNQYVTVFDRGNTRVGFGKTECSIPYNTDYEWDLSPWDSCRKNTTCLQYRTVSCNSTKTGSVVLDGYCSFLSIKKPPLSRDCCSDPSPDDNNGNSSDGPFSFLLNQKNLVAFIGGCVAGFVILLVCLICCCRRRSRAKLEQKNVPRYEQRSNVVFKQLPLLDGNVQRSDVV